MPRASSTAPPPRTSKQRPRATDATSQQREHLAHLFAHPHAAATAPRASTSSSSSVAAGWLDELGPVKDFVSNIQGSSAGAGSGDFHVYRAHRRREQVRQKRMEDERVHEQHDTAFQAKRQRAETEAATRTAKHRRKRMLKRAAKAAYDARAKQGDPRGKEDPVKGQPTKGQRGGSEHTQKDGGTKRNEVEDKEEEGKVTLDDEEQGPAGKEAEDALRSKNETVAGTGDAE